MGQSKRRAAEREKMRDLEEEIIPRLSSAMQRLAAAASGHFGADCYIHAAIPQAILKRLGIEAKIVIGFAGWRVGNGDSDVVLHAPVPGMVYQPGGVPLHVWLEIGTSILDFTTYQLRQKAADLDALDGGHTTVDWCPDCLYVSKFEVSSLDQVARENAGLFYYEHNEDAENLILSTAPALDQADVEAAWMLFQNPALQAFGPNNVSPVFECSAGPGEFAAGPGVHVVNPQFWC